MNRYLEKVAELEKEALNALKARAMAHEAGVVVDPDTQWKWALRQFRRGPEGKVAQGRDRAQILNRIMGNPAAGNNNFRQAIQSEQRKLLPNEEVQLIRERAKKGTTTSKAVPAVNENESVSMKTFQHKPLLNNQLHTAVDTHVHPRGEGRVIEKQLADSAKRRKSYWGMSDTNLYDDSYFRSRGGPHRAASPSGSYNRREIGSDTSTKLGWTKPNPEARLEVSTKADLGAYSIPGRTAGIPANIIASPTEEGKVFLGNHRVIPAGALRPVGTRGGGKERGFKGVRSSYLDLTPRKARAENPYLDKLHEMGKTL